MTDTMKDNNCYCIQCNFSHDKTYHNKAEHQTQNTECQNEHLYYENERIVEAIQRDKYLAGLAVGTFENYMQYTGKLDSLKEFKELIETHCPNITDFEEMFSHYWGHREGEEEE